MKTTANIAQPERLAFLDGFRGLAILMVVSFHVFSHHNELTGFMPPLSDFFIFRSGWLGAELFFLVSGFVILMTLRKCSTLKKFLMNRWIRLFPAMLISSLVLLISYAVLREGRYFPDYSWIDVFPGLTFIDPYLWNVGLYYAGSTLLVTGLNISFWTIFVEVKFYLFFGYLYFKLGERKAVYALMVWYFVSFLVEPVSKSLMPLRILSKVFSGLYFGWFAVGAMMYFYWKGKERKDLLLAILFSILTLPGLSKVKEGIVSTDYLMALAIILLFIAAVAVERVRPFVSGRILLFFGFISYPLYLIHEPILIPALYSAQKMFPAVPREGLAIILLTGVTLLSVGIAKYLEPHLKCIIQRRTSAKNASKSRD